MFAVKEETEIEDADRQYGVAQIPTRFMPPSSSAASVRTVQFTNPSRNQEYYEVRGRMRLCVPHLPPLACLIHMSAHGYQTCLRRYHRKTKSITRR